MERRCYPNVSVECRAGRAPVIQGYAAVFYRADDPGSEFELWDDFVERIEPDAFTASLEGADVRGLVNHDPSQRLGRTAAGTMRLTVDERGLRYEIDPPDTQVGRDTITSIRRGDLDGSSFSFNVNPGGARMTREGVKSVRILTDVTLFDVGPVTFPAYQSATSEVRAANNQDMDALRAEFDAWQEKRSAVTERLEEITRWIPANTKR